MGSLIRRCIFQGRILQFPVIAQESVRHFTFGRSFFIRSRTLVPYILAINKRKQMEKVVNSEKGKDPVYRRSSFLDWNYNAEIYAFVKRLGENFDESKLRQAFISQSYISKIKIEEDNAGGTEPEIMSNIEMIEKGEKCLSTVVKGYLRAFFPKLPEEGVIAFHKYLTTEEILSHISSHIGTKDLILSEEYPPSEKTLSDTFKAIINVLECSTEDRVNLFIHDFVLTQLVGKDLSEVWEIADPISILLDILQKSGIPKYESRLQFESGRRTIEAVYQVGLYSDKKLIGSAFGETVHEAEEMAARDALRKIFNLQEWRNPLPFNKSGEISLKTKENPDLASYKAENIVFC